ncbi:ATP-binding protein [Ectothiorhodospiraceae bacterium BW-2]|nr:ATP-binding protein [Ectothiorhodospiraceae bacterium BW-2]
MDQPQNPVNWDTYRAAVWRRGRGGYLHPVSHIDPVQLDQLIGIERQKRALVANTERFLAAKPANNALLWGSRGSGKSSLIKALLNRYALRGLRLIQFERDDLIHLPQVVDEIRDLRQRFIIFCDDLSFEQGELSFRALKSVLEGSIELPADNVRLYATSNRRHLLPESMAENLAAEVVGGELHLGDATEEKISLSDRFGLQLSFHPNSQDHYLALIDHYFNDYRGDRHLLHAEALRYALERGSRSGRTAQQFFNSRGES